MSYWIVFVLFIAVLFGPFASASGRQPGHYGRAAALLLVGFVINVVGFSDKAALAGIVSASKMGVPESAESIQIDENAHDIERHVGGIIGGHITGKPPSSDCSRSYGPVERLASFRVYEGPHIQSVIWLPHRQWSDSPIMAGTKSDGL